MISIIIPVTDPLRLLDPTKNIDTELIKSFVNEECEIIIELDRFREGKGITLQRGLRRAHGGTIVWLDDDMQIHPDHLRELLVTKGDIVIGSKHNPLSYTQYGWFRKLVRFLGACVTRLLFNLPITDTQTGLKRFRRDILDKEWKVKGFGHDIEVLQWAYENKYNITQVPVIITSSEDSSVNAISIIRTLMEVLWLKCQLSFPVRGKKKPKSA